MGKIEFDYTKLRKKIKEKGYTLDSFGKALGMCHTTITHKLSNKYRWTNEEIFKACQILDINLEDISEYFFVVNV